MPGIGCRNGFGGRTVILPPSAGSEVAPADGEVLGGLDDRTD
jgi:hypothetical protein